jgi:hypothetical protein
MGMAPQFCGLSRVRGHTFRWVQHPAGILALPILCRQLDTWARIACVPGLSNSTL